MGAKPAKPLESPWRVTSVEELPSFDTPGKQAWINTSAVADGAMLAGAESGVVQWWSSAGEPSATRLPNHRAVINCVRALPCGDLYVATSSDKTFSVFSRSMGKRVQHITAHSRKVHWLILVPPPTTLAASGAGHPNAGWTLVTVGNDKQCMVWDVSTWKCLRSFTHHAAGAYSGVLLNGAAGLVATGDTGGGIHVWNARTGASVLSIPTAHAEWVTGLCHLPARNELVSVSADATVRKWDLATGQCVSKPAHPCGRCTCIQLVDAANSLFVTSSYSRNFALWDGGTMECVRRMGLYDKKLSAVTLLPQDDWQMALAPGKLGVEAVCAGLVAPGAVAEGSGPRHVALALGSLNLSPLLRVRLRIERLGDSAARAAWDGDAANETPLEVDSASAEGFTNPIKVAAVAGGAVLLLGAAAYFASSTWKQQTQQQSRQAVSLAKAPR